MKKIFLLLIIVSAIGSQSCRKPKGQTMPDVKDQLTRKYCNDPKAINYNDSFPGTPDNTTCIYPADKYVGTWDVIDSIFRLDKSFESVVNRTIRFIATPDDAKAKMDMTGWCLDNQNFAFKMQATKYRRASIINNIPGVDTGQIICNNDTMSGSLSLLEGIDTAINISFYEQKTNGVKYYHKAIGIKR